jgi:type IV pilus assembly protein PilB
MKQDNKIALTGELALLKSIKGELAKKNHPNKVALAKKVLGLLSEHAYKRNAGEIHFNTQKNDSEIKFKVNSVLKTVLIYDERQIPILAEFKKACGADFPNENDYGKNRKKKLRFDSHLLNFKLSALPGLYGDKFILKLLGTKKHVFEINGETFLPQTLKRLDDILSHPAGLMIISGQNQSGKTTTAYSICDYLSKKGLGVFTLEDEIEQEISGPVQSQVTPKKGFDKINGLKCLIAQHPDALMLSSIDSAETADLTITAIRNETLVLTCVGASSAINAIENVLKIGFDTKKLQACLLGVLWQKLLRRNCPHCRQKESLNEDILNRTVKTFPNLSKELLLKTIRHPKSEFFFSTGCAKCICLNENSFIPVFEILSIKPDAKELELSEPAVLSAWYHASNGLISQSEIAKLLIKPIDV